MSFRAAPVRLFRAIARLSPRPRESARWAVWSASIGLLAFGAHPGCFSSETPPPADAGPQDAEPLDALAPTDAGAVGTECVFNADCISAARCACTLGAGCACELGARGAGKSGIDACEDGNQCETALCVEGTDGGSFCSGPCEGPAQCGPALPRCVAVAGLGRICARASR